MLVLPSDASTDVLVPMLGQLSRFCERHVDTATIDAQARIPTEVFAGLGALGVFGVTVPEVFGGAGLGLAEACAVVDVLARHDASVAVSVGLHLGLGTRGLVRFGTLEQQRCWLPLAASGECIAAFSSTEPGAGSDLSSLRTTVREVGDALHVDGEKSYVTNGNFAGLFTVVVASPGLGGARRGQSLVLLTPNDAGFSVQREEHKLGLRGSSTTGLRFDDVVLPRKRLLGEAGAGSGMVQHVLCWGRTLMSAGCCGAAAGALDTTLRHTAARHQFGRPLASLDVVRERLARLKARLYAMQAVVLATARARDEAELSMLSTVAKVFCSEGAGWVADEAVQLHGALGFIEDTGLARVLRDVRVTRIFEGANDVLLTHLGAGVALERAALPADTEPQRALGHLAARLAQTHRLRLMGAPRLLHALGIAKQWAVAATLTARRAELADDATSRAMAHLVEREALEVIARASLAPTDEALLSQVMGPAHRSAHP